MAKWFPSAAYHGDRAWAVHIDAPFILGDGITLGEQVGAQITGHDRGLIQPTPGFARNVEAFLPPWVVAVNKEGKRFEVEAIWGEPLRRAMVVGAKTPRLESLYAQLKEIDMARSQMAG